MIEGPFPGFSNEFSVVNWYEKPLKAVFRPLIILKTPVLHSHSCFEHRVQQCASEHIHVHPHIHTYIHTYVYLVFIQSSLKVLSNHTCLQHHVSHIHVSMCGCTCTCSDIHTCTSYSSNLLSKYCLITRVSSTTCNKRHMPYPRHINVTHVTHVIRLRMICVCVGVCECACIYVGVCVCMYTATEANPCDPCHTNAHDLYMCRGM
jgi:hypothetical protein